MTARAARCRFPHRHVGCSGWAVAATLAANVAHGLGHRLAGATVAAWPAVALVGSYELLLMVIRGSQVQPDVAPETGRNVDPLRERAAELFAGSWRRTGFPRCALSVLNSTSDSPGHSRRCSRGASNV